MHLLKGFKPHVMIILHLLLYSTLFCSTSWSSIGARFSHIFPLIFLVCPHNQLSHNRLRRQHHQTHLWLFVLVSAKLGQCEQIVAMASPSGTFFARTSDLVDYERQRADAERQRAYRLQDELEWRQTQHDRAHQTSGAGLANKSKTI